MSAAPSMLLPAGWLLWLFPCCFLLHEAEECFGLLGRGGGLPEWALRNRRMLTARHPRLGALFARLGRISRGWFAAIALEENLLVVAATLYAALSCDLRPWLALFAAFLLHLLLHGLQALVVGCMFPGMVSAVVALPAGALIWGVAVARSGLSVGEVFCWSIGGALFAGFNLAVMHRLAEHAAADRRAGRGKSCR